jgi:hypothetical protein
LPGPITRTYSRNFDRGSSSCCSGRGIEHCTARGLATGRSNTSGATPAIIISNSAMPGHNANAATRPTFVKSVRATHGPRGGGSEVSHSAPRSRRVKRRLDEGQTDVRVLLDLNRASARIHSGSLCKRSELSGRKPAFGPRHAGPVRGSDCRGIFLQPVVNRTSHVTDL